MQKRLSVLHGTFKIKSMEGKKTSIPCSHVKSNLTMFATSDHLAPRGNVRRPRRAFKEEAEGAFSLQ